MRSIFSKGVNLKQMMSNTSKYPLYHYNINIIHLKYKLEEISFVYRISICVSDKFILLLDIGTKYTLSRVQDTREDNLPEIGVTKKGK